MSPISPPERPLVLPTDTHRSASRLAAATTPRRETANSAPFTGPRDPPHTALSYRAARFGSVVEVVEIRENERCGGLARVRVRDLENHSEYFQFWISLPHLSQSVVEYDGPLAEVRVTLGPMSYSETGTGLPCENLEQSLAEMLRIKQFLRSVECLVDD